MSKVKDQASLNEFAQKINDGMQNDESIFHLIQIATERAQELSEEEIIMPQVDRIEKLTQRSVYEIGDNDTNLVENPLFPKTQGYNC